MKKWHAVTLVAALALLAGVIMLCNRRGDSKTNIIPSDAKAVLALYPEQILSEFGISLDEMLALAAKNGIKDCGIDLSAPVYGFVCEDGTPAMTFVIEDKGDFSKLCESRGVTVSKQRGLNWCTHGMTTVCFDSEKALVMFSSSEMENRMVEMMEQKSGNSALLDNIKGMKGFLRISSQMDIIPEEYRQSGYLASLPQEADMLRTILNASMGVAGKSLFIRAGITSDDEKVRGQLSQIADVSAPIDCDLLDMSPESPLLWICGNIKGEKLLELLRQIPPVRTSLLAMNMCVDADMMLRAVDGDVSCAIPSFKLFGSDFLITASLSNTDFLSNVEDWKTGVSHDAGVRFEATTPTDFILTYEGIKTYFGVRDDKLYISNSKTLAATACRKSGNAERTAMKSDIGKYNVYASLDLKPLVSQYALYMSMLGAGQTVYEAIDKADRINVKVDRQCGIELELTAKEKFSDIAKSLMKSGQSN